jgi:ABC-type sugar transport system permease subunit
MALIVYFHGEGVLFSFMIQVFLGVVAGALLSYGIVKFKSLVGVMIAVGYATATFVTTFISQVVGSPRLEIAGWTLALPWSAIVPCYNLARSCSLTLPVSIICAGLNAAILYFLVVWLGRPR